MYVAGKTTLDIPTSGTAVLIEPPTAVIDIKAVGGFNHQALFAVEGFNTKVKTYVCWGVVGIFVNPSDVIAVELVVKLYTIPEVILNDGVVVKVIGNIVSALWSVLQTPVIFVVPAIFTAPFIFTVPAIPTPPDTTKAPLL